MKASIKMLDQEWYGSKETSLLKHLAPTDVTTMSHHSTHLSLKMWCLLDKNYFQAVGNDVGLAFGTAIAIYSWLSPVDSFLVCPCRRQRQHWSWTKYFVFQESMYQSIVEQKQPFFIWYKCCHLTVCLHLKVPYCVCLSILSWKQAKCTLFALEF